MEPELEEKFCELYQSYYFHVLKRTLVLVRAESTARDLTDEVFYKVVCELEKGNRKVLAIRYLTRMATNLCLDELRRQGARKMIELKDEVLCLDHVVGAGAGIERSISLHRLFEQIPPKLREIAIYRLVDGYSLDEIVELSNLSKRTLQRRLRKVLEFLRQEYGKGL
jgi:RNA polymerase sigma-70 factor (ECF subfamily)